ncbi:hypothetical protein LS684_04750 [Cytobacillus spongiae]|uniref:nitrilase-related carbon-nitrogen hydrolase n=1 Tax=Cytobacillus spongiae TaxID=2901381 RepID=UPI001F45D3D8|nr:nitrilase-related carbon-nitrogen hydrolase [Cytobacillus spongiae]UII56780.1 hypothetical protein LS684_04750 [Cytobacillus spongiae]
MVLSNGKFLIAPAAWIFPVLFLFAIKDMSWKLAWISLSLVTALSNQLSFHKMLPELPIPMFEFIPAAAGFLYAIPFVWQKIYFSKARSFLATFILPCTYSLLDFTNVYFNPYGTFGVLGYSQHDMLPIAQFASFIGVTGITFLITWVASIIYWVSLDFTKRRRVAIISVTALALIVTLGGLRMYIHQHEETVAVSGIHTVDRTDSDVLEIFTLHKKDMSDFVEKAEERMDGLLELTVAEAKSGAKIIHHSEGVIVIDESQTSMYLDKLKKVARKYQVYILTVPYIFTAEEEPNENVLYIINPEGDVALEHYKYGGNAVENTVMGNKELTTVDTEYGRLSGIICWDKDFPAVVDQIGELKVDILFIPSADWRELSPYHTIVGNFRGIENGANVVTQTVNGMSMITDYKGQVLTKMDHFSTDHWVMRGHVPTEGVTTFYSLFGKYLVGCIILILALTIVYIHRLERRKKLNH